MPRIDINCDMGESFGPWKMGDDDAIMPFITSANIACGAHAGDSDVMLTTVRLAKRYGVAVGAHPGYFDLRYFGRRPFSLSPDEVMSLLLYQVGALAGVAKSEGLELSHVKPHGALYNQACADAELAATVAKAVAIFSKELPLFGLPGSNLQTAAHEAGLMFVAEGFADRTYEPNGSLRDRKYPDALVTDAQKAAENAVNLANGQVRTVDGSTVEVEIQTLCVHGDTPGAARLAEAVNSALRSAGFVLGNVGS